MPTHDTREVGAWGLTEHFVPGQIRPSVGKGTETTADGPVMLCVNS
jgi:hypothetical protein